MLAGLLLFFAPAVLTYAEFTYRDTGRMHAPMKQWIGQELSQGRLPEWNPHAGVGAPVVANAVDAAQHPLSVLFIALSPGIAMKLWILCAFVAAALGAFAWARALGRTEAASAVAAFAFALSGPIVSASDNVTYLTAYATLPWLLAAAQMHARKGNPGWLASVGVASAALVVAGDPQSWAIGVALLPAQALLFAPPHGRRKAARRGFVAAAVAVVAAAPVLVPLAMWLPHSARASGLAPVELTRWNLHPRRIFEFVVPEIFRGDPQDPIRSPAFDAFCGNEVTGNPWFLSIYLGCSVVWVALVGAARDRRYRILGFLALVFVWAALGHHAGFVQLAAKVPLLGSFRFWEKLTACVALIVAACAARGLDSLEAGEAPRWASRAVAALVALAAAVAVLALFLPRFWVQLTGGPRVAAELLAANVGRGATHVAVVLGALGLILVLIRRGRLSRAPALAIGLVIAFDVFGGNAGAYVLGPPQRVAPPPLAAALSGERARVVAPFSLREDRWPELGRVASTWEWTRRTLGASWNVPLGIGNPHDYVGLRDGRWATYRAAQQDGADTARLGLFAFAYLVVPQDPALAQSAGLAPPHRVVASDPELPAYLVEMPHRPRAYVAARVDEVDADGALAFALAGGTPGRTVVEAPIPPGIAATGAGEARIVRDDPGAVDIEAHAIGGGALIVLNDLFAPGWSASIDGRRAEIVRANALVRGVWINAGPHSVRYRYRTPGLVLGWCIAGAGAAALAGWAMALRIRRRSIEQA